MRVVAVCMRAGGKRLLPVLSMAYYINTREGWQLYARCREAGDLRPYRAARSRWEAAHRDQLAEGREISPDQLRSWSNADAAELPVIVYEGVTDGVRIP